MNSKYPCLQEPNEAAMLRWYTYKENRIDK